MDVFPGTERLLTYHSDRSTDTPSKRPIEPGKRGEDSDQDDRRDQGIDEPHGCESTVESHQTMQEGRSAPRVSDDEYRFLQRLSADSGVQEMIECAAQENNASQSDEDACESNNPARVVRLEVFP